MAVLVTTVSTPLAAQASWWSTWVCQLKREPALMAKVATVTAGPGGEHCPSGDTSWQRRPYDTRALLRSVTGVNENHARLCPSPQWAAYIQADLLPTLVDGIDLGDELLEIGPGPGAALSLIHI